MISFRLHPVPSARRGFNLLEGAVVLFVLTIVITAVWQNAASVSENQKGLQSVDEIWQIATNIRNKYTGQTPPANAIQDAVCGGIFPRNMLQGTNIYKCNGASVANTPAPYMPWAGGGVTLDITTSSFTIKANFPGTPATKNIPDCIKYISRFRMSSGRDGNPTSIKVSRSTNPSPTSWDHTFDSSNNQNTLTYIQTYIQTYMTSGCGCVGLTFNF
jgi:hypothetical protein